MPRPIKPLKKKRVVNRDLANKEAAFIWKYSSLPAGMAPGLKLRIAFEHAYDEKVPRDYPTPSEKSLTRFDRDFKGY